MMIKTLRFRLTVWHVGFSAALLLLFSFFVYTLLASSLLARLDDKLASQATTAAGLLVEEIRESNGDVLKAAFETVKDMGLGSEAVVVLRDGVPIAGTLRPDFRHARREAGFAGQKLTIITGESLEATEASLRTVRRVIMAALPLFLLLAGAGGYVLTGRQLAPLQSMAAQARRISTANLDHRLQVDAATELATLAGAFNDILGRLHQSFETMRRFVADASHEIRTPLSIIRGEADLALAHDRPGEEYRASLGVILDESRQLSRLVEDLLNLARADAGQVKLQVSRFDFGNLVAECCRSVERLAASHDVALEWRGTAGIPFSGDPNLLRRLVLNLLDNAIRYTPDGGKVTASIETRDRAVRLAISDTGIGIPPDALPHVFDRFFRVDTARSCEDGGSGLGLSIVKWIAETHRGGVDVESRPNAGSTFVVTLPL